MPHEFYNFMGNEPTLIVPKHGQPEPKSSPKGAGGEMGRLLQATCLNAKMFIRGVVIILINFYKRRQWQRRQPCCMWQLTAARVGVAALVGVAGVVVACAQP